jgi:hypothetical protein
MELKYNIGVMFGILCMYMLPSFSYWKCGDCSPRIRFEPIDFGYPYGRDWSYGVYLEVPLPYRDEQGRMFAFGWHR